MQKAQQCLTLIFASLLVVNAGATRVHRGPTSAKQKTTRSGKHSKAPNTAAAKPRAMDDARATQIQTALVKAGYLQDVSGHWDSASQAAMQKLQADNGWQTKMIPDSRALIKLGLGPNASLELPTPTDRTSDSSLGY